MIVVFGSLNIDLVMPVQHFPKPGETVLCTTDYLSRPGGKGSNQAVAAARAGAKVVMVGKVGDDSFGRRCINNLKNYSIWTAGIGISERPTGCSTIGVDARGANFVMSAPGANLETTADQVPDEVFTDKNIILAQMEIPSAETFTVLKRGKQKGAITVLDASPAGHVTKEVLGTLDYVIANSGEAQKLAASLGIEGTDPHQLAPKIAAIGNNLTCIITMEDKGCVAAQGGQIFAVSALPVEVVDTTGAGDAFCGVFAGCLQAGKNWLAALHYASIGASLSCLGLGAQGSTPTIEDIEANLNKIPLPRKIS